MKTNWTFERSIPLLFLLVTITAYGLLLPFTGFYWDDWPFAWIAKFLGPQEFIPAFAGVRPFLGPIFFITTSLIPPVPLYWQIFALVIRFTAVLSAWFALKQIWPHHQRQALVASLLFLVFPGYSQHWVAFTHINQEWIPFTFYLLSFGFTARALREFSVLSGGAAVKAQVTRQALITNKYTVYALLFMIAGIFPTEYFVSIEPIRFLFIWIITAEQVGGFRQRFIESLKRWIPYILIWLANGAWLAYFYTIGGYASYEVEVASEPLTPIQVLSTAGEAIWKAGFYIWAQILVLTSKAITAPTALTTFALIILAFVFILFYLRRLNLSEQETTVFAMAAILIGLVGILLGRVPSFAAGLPLTLQSSYDRFMISMMLGGSLFVTGLVELFIPKLQIKTYIFAFLIALGVGQQFYNANIFRRDWMKQQEIYWQLAWRIPAMKPGTALLTNQLPIDYETDLSFTAPINWMYTPDYKRSSPVDERSDLPYALLYTEKRLGGTSLPSLEPHTEISLSIRRVSFRGSTSQAIVIYMPPNGCLRVLDPAYGDEETYEKQSRYLVEAIPLSNPREALLPDPMARPVFVPEPPHTWCYYYTKAEAFARDAQDWGRVISLDREVKAKGYLPEDPLEWLPFIEANAMIANFDRAEQLSIEAITEDHRVRKAICNVWKRVQAQSPIGSEGEPRVNRILSNFECPP